MAAYALEGPRWGNGAAGSGATVSWAVDGSVPTSFLAEIRAAFATWSSYANLNFQQVSSTAIANIDFRINYIDGLNTVLGQASYYYSGQRFTSAQITFDSGEGWRVVGSDVRSSSGVDFYVVALHEIGHAVGLDHYNDSPALMNAYLSSSVTGPAASDISGIQALYGAPVAIVTTGTGYPAPSVPTVSPPNQALNAAQFGSFAYSAASVGGKVFAVYDALLGRAADPLGLEAWTKAIDHGLTLTGLAQGFLTSPEGQARAGALDNGAFVEQLYGATLHRSSDSLGFQSWTAALAQGSSRAEVALSFALSDEHLAMLQPTFNRGVFVPDASVAEAARLYYGILGRAPDAPGLSAAANALKHGTSLTSLAQQFVSAPEGQAKVAGFDNARFVASLYENALGRPAEASGLQYWVEALEHGTTRAEVAVLVSESYEAQIHLVGRIETGWELI